MTIGGFFYLPSWYPQAGIKVRYQPGLVTPRLRQCPPARQRWRTTVTLLDFSGDSARSKKLHISSLCRFMRTRPIAPSEYITAKACLLIWACSLLLPAFHVVGHETYHGVIPLILGWLFFITDESLFFKLAWWANPLFLLALGSLESKRPVMTCIFASASVLLSASFVLVTKTYLKGAGGTNLIELRFGYVLWVVSMLFVLLAGVVMLRREQAYALGPRHWVMLISIVLIGISYIVLGLQMQEDEFPIFD